MRRRERRPHDEMLSSIEQYSGIAVRHFLGNIKARDPCRAMARICLRRKFQAGASVVHLVKCTQVQEHIFTVMCTSYMNYISCYARLRHPEALVIGTGPMPLFRPLGLVDLASREHSCRGLKQHHHAYKHQALDASQR